MALKPTAAASDGASFSERTRLLVVAPHPDDETIATGLLIQQVKAAGGEVRVLLLTSGDNNPWPQRWLERRWHIGDAGRQRWGQRRHAEVVTALQSLGVPVSGLQALAWPDLGVTDRLLRTTREAVSAVASVIAGFQPGLIAFPALEDSHPDHSAAHILVRLALLEQAESPRLWTYLVHGTTSTDASIRIHGTERQQFGKRTALSAHRTQLALSATRLYRLVDGPERYRDSTHDLPSMAHLPWRPPRFMQPWLQLSVVSATGAQIWPWSEAPLHRDDQGKYALVGMNADVRFVKLTLRIPSPWIFDHWGWCALSG